MHSGMTRLSPVDKLADVYPSNGCKMHRHVQSAVRVSKKTRISLLAVPRLYPESLPRYRPAVRHRATTAAGTGVGRKLMEVAIAVLPLPVD